MSDHLTVCWITNRKDSQYWWFLDSLYRECGGHFDSMRIVTVNPHFGPHRDLSEEFNRPWITCPPKPSVWQGPYRRTKVDWFAASNARNTGLCFAPDGWIVYADDLSVLMPGWLNAVREAVSGGYIACGAYMKRKDMVVENGKVKSFTEHEPGIDNRYQYGNDDGPIECGGQWLYGCSVAMPVDALLNINGWPEDLCDGMGFEDCLTGLVLQNAGYTLKYDRRMLTYESEELHHVEPPLKRSDYGVSPEDKSHAALKIAQESKRFDNPSLGLGGIRELREKVLRGEPFPVVPTEPVKEWFTGTPLEDL